ncbi:MAG: DUF2490 domain-containing protein [Chitinophagales bacterium]|nr:DUF2490 domain-containing protein [Chitinophagales bacterium]
MFAKRKFLSVALFAFCLTALRAQEEVQDVQLWTGVQISKDLPKRFSIGAQYQLRLDNDVSQVKGSYFSANIGYTILKKYLSVELEYRYVASPDKDRHRFGIDLIGKYKWKKVAFTNRLSYQREHEYFNSRYERGHEPTNYIRNRFKVRYDLPKRFEVYASIEPFVKISNKFRNVDRVRTVAGAGWEFVKNHHFDLFYLYQIDVNVRRPKMGHGIGLMYGWDIPRFKKKKAKKS